jgi:hypothetical protein
VEVTDVTELAHRDTHRPGRRFAEDRLEILELLRRAAVYVETAALLDRRAGRCASPALAGVLRDRAATHRRNAERVRADLASHGVRLVARRP